MMNKTILCALIILSFIKLEAQSLYAVTSQNKIYRINEDYTATSILTIDGSNGIKDIAISPSGEMYGLDNNNIYHIDLISGLATHLTALPNGTHTSLLCDSNFQLYIINPITKMLYKYNLLTDQFTDVIYLGFRTPGDLTFYKGNIIFQPLADGGLMDMIKTYNPETGTITDMMCDQFTYIPLVGLATIHDDCNSEIVIASSYDDLYVIDIENQTKTILPTNLNGDAFFGLASTNEYLGSLCEAQDLSNLNCSLSTIENHQKQITFYPNPATEKLFFSNHEKIKQVVIYNITGKPVRTISHAITEIDISDLAAGVYLLKIESDKTSDTRKLVKQ